MSKILIAEDEVPINKMICMNLNLTGYETVSFTDGQQVLDYLALGGSADLALVDVMMPKVDGFALLVPLKEAQIPVIYLTARGDLEAKVRGLSGGAEDYMVKPFEMVELLLRIQNVLRRYRREEPDLQLENVRIETINRKVYRDGKEIMGLTPMEYDLLLMLARHKNLALSREQLLDAVWGYDYQGGTRTVDVHIAQLRKKTGLRIVALPKIGYRLEVDG